VTTQLRRLPAFPWVIRSRAEEFPHAQRVTLVLAHLLRDMGDGSRHGATLVRAACEAAWPERRFVLSPEAASRLAAAADDDGDEFVGLADLVDADGGERALEVYRDSDYWRAREAEAQESGLGFWNDPATLDRLDAANAADAARPW
jgi:hypothetical protein